MKIYNEIEYKTNINVFLAQTEEDFTEVFNRIAPYQKVAFLGCESDIARLKGEIARLEWSGVKVVRIIVSDNFYDDVDSISRFSFMHEDIRAVVATSCLTARAADYVAAFKGVPSVQVCLDEISAFDVLHDYNVKNLNVIERFNPPEKRFVIAYPKSQTFTKNTLANVCSLTVVLCDYLCRAHLMGGAVNERAFNLLKRVIIGCMQSEYSIVRAVDGIVDAAKILVVGGINLSESSISIALAVSGRCLTAENVITVCSKAFKALLYGQENNAVDYVQRARDLQLESGLDYLYLIKGLKEQLENIKTIIGASEINEEIKNLSRLYVRFIKKLAPTVSKLNNIGGVDVCGDTPLGINAMTNVRER